MTISLTISMIMLLISQHSSTYEVARCDLALFGQLGQLTKHPWQLERRSSVGLDLLLDGLNKHSQSLGLTSIFWVYA